MDGAGFDTQFFQDGAGVFVGEARGVVVAAEMAEEEVPQAGVHELADGVAQASLDRWPAPWQMRIFR